MFFCHFDEVSAIIKPKMMTFSITGSQIFLADFIIFTKSEQKATYLSYLTVCPCFKVKRGYPNLKVLITCLLLVLQVCNVKLTYRKSWAGNLLM